MAACHVSENDLFITFGANHLSELAVRINHFVMCQFSRTEICFLSN